MKTKERVFKDQEIFREIMTAMSRPGLMCGAGAMGEDPLMDVLNVLLDHEVSFCVTGGNKQELETLIKTGTGSRPEDMGKADFIIAAGGDIGAELNKVKKGLPEYPDQGATIIYYIAGQDNGKNAVKCRFSGPGVDPGLGPVDPLITEGELRKLAEMNSGYPLGVDAVIVTKRAGLMCMPRSLRISFEGGK